LNSEIEQALVILDSGGVVGMPTETVYGLAARIDNNKGLQKIFATKKRPFFDPLIVHVSSVAQAQSLTTLWPKAAQILTETFWPGPLTLVLPKSSAVSDLITSGLPTVGVRMPNHPQALVLIERAACPLAAPSANLFGKTSPTQASHVRGEFGDEVFVIDGGPSMGGIESTILAISEGTNSVTLLTLLRPGLISADKISTALQKHSIEYLWQSTPEKALAPGLMKHHYMPSVPLIILTKSYANESALKDLILEKVKQAPSEVEGVQIKKISKIDNWSYLKLSESSEMAARELYSHLRSSAEQGTDCILFKLEEFHKGAEWEPIMNRLTKAATIIL
jgi:L-threonylcarbamoyladenylate synthase